MKQAGVVAIIIGSVLFVVAIATAFASLNSVLDAQPPLSAIPWQLQVSIEALIGFVFFIPGVAMVNHRK